MAQEILLQIPSFGSASAPIVIVVTFYALQFLNISLREVLTAIIYFGGLSIYLSRYPLRMKQFKEQWNQEHGPSV